ncbi:MAG: GNAT family N-acetyltransferase [Chitinophagales bacterium]|nr:GNAT family N-acetyltransferase [Chitinophagales bacterium]
MSLHRVYKIETERLLIRCYDPEDASQFHSAITQSLEHLLPWMPWAKDEPTDIETKINLLRTFRGNFDLGKDYPLGIFTKETQKFIGSTGFHIRSDEEKTREIGYWLHVDYINCGFAMEAVSALIQVGFLLEGLENIDIFCHIENTRSQGIPKKLGFTLNSIKEKKDVSENIQSIMQWRMDKTSFFEHQKRYLKIHAFDIVGRPIPL